MKKIVTKYPVATAAIIISVLSSIIIEFVSVFWYKGDFNFVVSRSLALIFAWLVPFFVSVFYVYYSRSVNVLVVAVFIMTLAMSGAIFHYLVGEFIFPIDMSGKNGFRHVFCIYFIMGFSVVLFGIAFGFFMRKFK